jgi:hypothetical protein
VLTKLITKDGNRNGFRAEGGKMTGESPEFGALRRESTPLGDGCCMLIML